MKSIFLLICLGIINYQSSGQICLTDENVPDYFSNHSVPMVRSSGYTVRIAVHVIIDNAGNKVSANQLSGALQMLENDLAPHNICISLANLFYTVDDQIASGNILPWSSYPSSNAIDIYLLPPTSQLSGGLAAVPNTHLYISGTNTSQWGGQPYIETHALSHEFGHCLGLYHTFHGSPQCTDGGCQELVNGSCYSTCTGSCGDFVQDTPVDPCLGNSTSLPIQMQVDPNTCLYLLNILDINGDQYNPDTRNIMSYSFPSCIQYFSPGQGARMRQLLATSFFTDMIVPDDIYIQNINLNNWYDVKNYISPQSINAGYNVNSMSTNGNVDFGNAAQISFLTKGYISLESGFSASPTNIAGPSDGFFDASIDPNVCGYIQGINSARISHANNNFIIPSKWLSTFRTPEGYESNLSYSKGDTIINGNSYTIIKRDSVNLPGINTNPFTYIDDYKYIRYDSIIDKTFIYENGQDNLLYDYNLNIGDSFPAPNSFHFVLTTVDSVLLLTGYRKRLIFENTGNNQIIWIKGIGNIFAPFGNSVYSNSDFLVLCYYENGVMIYENQSSFPVQCSNYSSIADNKNETGIDLYPNPFESSINYDTHGSNIDYLCIIDITGHLVFENKNPQTKGNIKLEGMSSGIYFLKYLIKDKGVFVNKIVKG